MITKTDVRRRLIAAAAELISERGPDAVNSNQIARAAGVGVGSFYAHFKDKHELRSALTLSVADALRVRVQQATTAAASPEPEPQVRALVRAVVGYAQQNPQLFRAAFGPEGGVTVGRPGVGLSSRAVERRLRSLQQQGRIHPALHAGVAARAFTCMQNGVISWWLEDPRRARPEELIETLVRLHPALAR